MKTKIVFFFLIAIASYAQRPRMHLVIAADVEDNAYTVRNFSKEERIKNMFSLVCREMEFDLQIKYLHTFDFGFSSKGVLDSLSKIKILTRDDIVIFYYLGRGYYPNPSSKVPLLEFHDSKKMLSFEQIRKKIIPIKARLSLIVADCDESFSLLNPSVLPYSILKTSQLNAGPNNLEKAIYAALNSEFSVEQTSFETSIEFELQKEPSEDSIYQQKCFFELDEIINNKEKFNLDLVDLRHISLLRSRISEYSANSYPFANDIERKRNVEMLLSLEEKLYRTKNLTTYNYEYLVDSLFLKRKILDFKDSLNKRIKWLFGYENKPLVSPNWELENQGTVRYYFETMAQITDELNEINLSKPLKVKDIHSKSIFARLESYKKNGLPIENESNSKYRLRLFNNFPKITKANFKAIAFDVDDYQVVIDSMFIKRSLMNKEEPLSVLLDSLIEFENRPLIKPIEFLGQKEVDKYYDNLDKLEEFISGDVNTKEDSIKKIRLTHFFQRLESYIHIGFPQKNNLLPVVPSMSRFDDIFAISDYLYDKNELFDFNNPLQLKLDSIIDKSLTIHTLKLDPSEWRYYIMLKKTIQSLANNVNSQTLESQKLQIVFERLNDYPILGFPKNDKNRKRELEIIPAPTVIMSQGASNARELRKNIYTLIVDSLYLSKNLFNISDSLNIRLIEYINLDISFLLPLKNILSEEPSQRPIIMKLFLSECGIIEIANGHTQALKKNVFLIDYSQKITFNFSIILAKFSFKNIDDLSLEKVFSPVGFPFIHDFKRTLPVNCSIVSTNAELMLPDFKKIPSEDQVNDMFDEYVKAKSLSRKKVLKSEITGYFEKKALLKVKSVKPAGNTAVGSVNIPIKDYFDKLDKSTPKVDSVGVRQGSVKRNKNFSKITSMMVVEN